MWVCMHVAMPEGKLRKQAHHGQTHAARLDALALQLRHIRDLCALVDAKQEGELGACKAGRLIMARPTQHGLMVMRLKSNTSVILVPWWAQHRESAGSLMAGKRRPIAQSTQVECQIVYDIRWPSRCINMLNSTTQILVL